MNRLVDVEKIRSLLADAGCAYGRTIHYTEETDSTQNIAQQFIREGAHDGLLVLSETQTAGRGRLGRSWFSPAGMGIYMSLVLNPRVPYRFMPQLTIVTAAALCRVLRRMTGLDIRLKWPNDLYIEDRKICGILTEACSEERQSRIIVGTGITVNVPQEQFPEWLQDKATSLLAASGKVWERELIVAQYIIELDKMIQLYTSEGFSLFRTIWDAYAWLPDEAIAVMTPQGEVKGFPRTIDENGALVVQLENGQMTTIYSGDYQS